MNLDETRFWLEVLYGDTPGLIHISSTGNWAGRTFDNTDHALTYIQKLDATNPEGIYLRATTLRSAPAEGRGGDNLSFYLPGLWADVDIAGPGHKTSQPLPPDIDEAMRIVTESGLPEPSHWIHSGGGLYPWWLLKDPVEIDDLENFRNLSGTWQKILEASAAKLGYHYGSGVGDLSRILRVPGTTNRKAGLQRPCTALQGHAWNGRTYTLTELTDAMVAAAPEPPRPSRVEIKLAQQQGDRPGDIFNARTQWQDVLPGWTWVYKRGDKWHLRRPGKTHGTSATLSLTTDRFYPFSDEAKPFTPWTHYSKFEAYALLEHNGDFTSAARALRAMGYGSPATGSVAPAVAATGLAQADWADAALQQTQPQQAVAVRDPNWLAPWAKPTVPADAFVYTRQDYSSASRIYASVFEDTFKFCGEMKKWFSFAGKVWTEDKTLQHEDAVKFLLDEAHKQSVQEDSPELAKWVRTMGRASSPNLARWAKSDPRIAITRSQLDKHRHMITVGNGVYDLDSDTFTSGHDPKLLLTKQLYVNYDKDASCKRWTSLLETLLPDPQIRSYLQRAVGHTLLGDAQERALFILHGDPGTGKSQVVKVLERMFGDFAETANATTFNDQSKRATITNDLNDLRGKRFVAVAELDENERLNEALIKRLTGGDTAKSRGLYQENSQWDVEFSLWMVTNFLPRLSSDDAAMWTRVKPIKFPVVVKGQGEEVKKIGEQIFVEESSGILNWMLEGVRMYLAEGLDDLDQITEAVASYRRDVDNVAQFMDAATESNTVAVGEEQQIPSRQLHSIYQHWCQANDIRWLGERRFGQRMESLGFQRKKLPTANVWLGVGTGGYGMLGTMPMRQ